MKSLESILSASDMILLIGGYAPFLSLTARESAFTVISNTEKDVQGSQDTTMFHRKSR